MRKYNILNNSLGWFCFVVAAVTYLLTLEPTASFWDCPEFITQGFKLEVGHPPGNPIFMLTARFFANFALGDVTKVAWWINAMSALLSAATILLLFWTITHLVKRLIVSDSADSVSPIKMLVIFGSGICGALMYAWSDTFWFSAVEGEVYAFSSFCTALVFWLILKWENRADRPDSDKYLILIAYVIGISIAVHLLNLLCIPAIVLIIYFKRSSRVNTKGSLAALLISFVIVAFILYGLVPGLINVAQKFELFCVNTLSLSFNMGVLIYGILTVASFVWTIYSIYHSDSVRPWIIKLSFVISLLLSGILMIGGSTLIFLLLVAALIIYLWKAPRLSMRLLGLVTMSIFVMFIGYSSYALLLIRSSAHTPMNQNAPDNVFALSSYLNREQYGDRPLVYGETLNFDFTPDGRLQAQNPVIRIYDPSTGAVEPLQVNIRDEYARELKTDPNQPDRYHMTGTKKDLVIASEAKMLFPRIYSTAHVNSYASWLMGDLEGTPVDIPLYQLADGTTYRDIPMQKATFGENLRFFFVYQLNHMYWRYFMWNFAGRQNDIPGQGEPTHGNWISGIPALDNVRLGDQSLLPDDLGKSNKGHNVFFMLPLIMGIIGLLWQAARGQRGIEQFWVVFFLFFMTGIAIVLYLNQTPDQPRERDYAFAGSFYAYAIWVGMGVAGLWHYIRVLIARFGSKKSDRAAIDDDDAEPESKPAAQRSLIAAAFAAVIGLIVPLQVVSQTWDDHDRSGRYTARDYGMNYLNSLDKNAIIFTYGDNDTFPLWYAQEVEGIRTDVKVVNLSYLTTDWYINQIRRQSYDAPPVEISAPYSLYAYDANQFFSLKHTSDSLVDASTALEATYRLDQFDNKTYFAPKFVYPRISIPANADAALKAGRITPADSIRDITLDLRQTGGGIGINSVMVLDILNNSAKNGWNRPVYFAITVPTEQYIGLTPYFSQTGLAYEILPADNSRLGGINLDKMYRNITEKWRWGGLDAVKSPDDIYLDETVRRMVSSHRQAVLDLAMAMASNALDARFSPDADPKVIDDYVAKADTLIALQKEKLPTAAVDYSLLEVLQVAELYIRLYQATGDQKYLDEGLALTKDSLIRFAGYLKYYQSLSPTLRSTLSNADRIVEAYYRNLLQDYNDMGGDVNEIGRIVQHEMGVDLRPYLQNS